jgi:hypothetical protein
LANDLTAWTAALEAHGYRIATDDFLLRGDLGGHGAPDGHMTGNQAHTWPSRYFVPPVRKLAQRWPQQHGDILGATPYSLRRGMISLRIRAGEDRQAIAKQCGTSRGGTTPCQTSRSRGHPPGQGRLNRCRHARYSE